jgi:hypothetical protein
LKIPLTAVPSTGIAIEPDDTLDWKDLIPILPLKTAVLEGRQKRIRIQRRGDVRQPAAVTVSTRDVTARAGLDYIPASVRLEFQPYEIEKTIAIKILSDDQHESEETFEIILSDPVGAEAIAPPIRIRIVDYTEGFRLNNVRRLSNDQVEITYNWTKSGQRLQRSEDLRTWTDLPDAAPVNSDYEVRVIDHHPLSARARFYRLRRQ